MITVAALLRTQEIDCDGVALRTSAFLFSATLVAVFVLNDVVPGSQAAFARARSRGDSENYALGFARGGLSVDDESGRVYERLCEVVEFRAGDNDFIYATPDCPEVYLLTGRRNPTRTFYDFFDEQDGRVDRIMDVIEEKQIQVIVLNTRAAFSRMDESLRGQLTEEFPIAERVGDFEVRWRLRRRFEPRSD